MIDCSARDKAAQLLRQFVDGCVTTGEFEDAWPAQSDDLILKAIWWTAWGPASGQPRRQLKGAAELNADGRALFERCILFLRSDLEFDHEAPFPEPPRPGREQLRATATFILLLGVVGLYLLWGLTSHAAALLMLWGVLWVWFYHFAERAFCQPPEGWSIGVVVWPFSSQADYDRESARVANRPGNGEE